MTRIPPESLRTRCDPALFAFETTAELEPLAGPIGQDRALDAVRFGVEVRRPGYNLYVLGSPDTGKLEATSRLVAEIAGTEQHGDDWCYVNNFREPAKPRVLRLPRGMGARLRDDMAQLVEELRSAIPAVLESEEYRSRVDQIDAEFGGLQEQAFGALVEEAQKEGIALLRTPAGFSFAPAREGEVLPPEEFEKLPDAEKERIAQAMRVLQEKLEKILRQVVGWRKARREALKKLNQEVTMFAVGNLVDDLVRQYVALPGVVSYLDAVRKDVVDNAELFHPPGEGSPAMAAMQSEEMPPLRRYQVNLLVGDGKAAGAPVVVEENPTYVNLVGRVEHIARFGALVTDFALIRPGALHRANGGYLLLDLRKVLSQPFAWDALKRALQTREVRIESLGQMYGAVSTVSLEPQPIPLDLKVVLFGDRLFYQLLQAYDPEFRDLFKVAADFEDEAPRNDDNQLAFARLLATLSREAGLAPLDRQAAARLVEWSARYADDSEKLTLHVRRLKDMLVESEFWAHRAGRAVISAEDVQRAEQAQIERSDRIRRQMHEEILRETLMIDTSGEKVAQVNGLSVLMLGDFTFGQPSRITATTRLGDGQVVDIQREAELGGSIHSKGVMILSSFIASRYAARQPFSLGASLVFEQTYGEVDGDSASMAELCAILSSLAGVPVRQSLAITGSVNQRGEAQAIGAVNEKIEGFFDICSRRGLDGTHAVLIPRANVKHLMLRDDVVEAARDGRFAVHAYSNVDEAMLLLAGETAAPDSDEGRAAIARIDARVRARLAEFTEIRGRFGAARRGGRGQQ